MSIMECANKRGHIIAGLLILMELIDLGFDLDFVIEVYNTDQEPIRSEHELKKAILAFLILGFFTCIGQITSVFLDARKDYSNLTFSIIMSFISTWIEDISQIILAVWVAAISSEIVSKIQYWKAGYAIFEALIHFGGVTWQLCFKNEENGYNTTGSCLKKLIVLEVFGGVLILGASIFLLIELHFDNYH